MFDEDINSSCDSENKTYGDFKFWQICKELGGDITQLVLKFLEEDNEGEGVEK